MLRRLLTLITWFSTFGLVPAWVSDRISHFKIKLLNILRESLFAAHHYSLAYCPWSNSAVEVMCRELLRATRAVLSELELNQICWPAVIPMVQYALKNSVLERLGNRTPQSVLTSIPYTSPLNTATTKDEDFTKVHSLEDVRAKQLINIQPTHEELEGMHEDVSELSNRKGKQSVNSYNRKSNVGAVNFDVADFVLRGL